MQRTANAHWTGTIKEGKGTLSTQSSLLNQANYGFKTRFVDEEKGTNPEELLAAAHAGCFTMTVSYALTELGYAPKSLDTKATVKMDGAGISGVHLKIRGEVEGISQEEFKTITLNAESNCLISKILNIPVESEALLVG